MNPTPPLDELYFRWLYGEVCYLAEKDPNKTFWTLFRVLYTKEFIWLIPNDDNRAEDGKDLRHEFVRDIYIVQPDPNWLRMPCSFLEMLIGLCRRFAFEADCKNSEAFWEMLENLNLHKLNDNTLVPIPEVEEIIDCVIWRQYHYDGRGGLFPLRRPSEDQRQVELWYQLSAYLLEMD